MKIKYILWREALLASIKMFTRDGHKAISQLILKNDLPIGLSKEGFPLYTRHYDKEDYVTHCIALQGRLKI